MPGISTLHRSITSLLALTVVCLSVLVSACHHGDRVPDPKSPQYVDTCRAFYVGLAALQAGDDRRAEDELTKATELAPGEPAAWADLGMLSLKDREFDAAAQRLQKAAELAPENSRIIQAEANLAAGRGNLTDATKYLRQVIKLDPKNLKAIYSLAEDLESIGGDQNEQEAQQLMLKILDLQPDNLAVQLDVIRLAAKRGDTKLLQDTLARVASSSQAWPQNAREQLATLQSAAAGTDQRLTGQRIAFLRNVLAPYAGFRTSLAEVKLPPGEVNEPFTRFLKLPSPSPSPAPMDDGLAFTAQPVSDPAGGAWSWAGAVSLTGEGNPVMAVANSKQVKINGQTLLFPGGPSNTPPSVSGVLALDYDFKTDLVLAGAGGFKLYKQEDNGTFTDVLGKIPASVTPVAYWGAWAADIEMDGNLDIVLAPIDGQPLVLRNNGDGTLAEAHPFEGVTNVRGFAWADLDGDGAPDAVFLSADGRIHVYMNQRAGLFRARTGPDNVPPVYALGTADVNGDGVMDLIAAQADGGLIAISDAGDASAWKVSKLTDPPQPALPISDFSGQIIVADLDNNGASDLVCSCTSGSAVWLADPVEKFSARPLLNARAFSAADLNGDGVLDLAGVTSDGQAVQMIGKGTKGYHWQTLRPKAANTTGAQRINSFGLGGEMEVRSGLLFQKQSIASPIVHFGLGQNTETDVLRIVWPNGTPQAEFDLGPDQTILINQRLKGSCPSLFAFDGTGMRFVKDCAPWSAVMGVRLSTDKTETVDQTEEWTKISGNQLSPRDGYYDLRITAELWESYYIDHYSLMVVDHPDNVDAFVDERSGSSPLPRLGIYTVGHPQPVKAAWDDQGHDVSDLIRTVDGHCLDTFERGLYRGATKTHFVEVELGDDAPTSGTLYLIATGWTVPTDSSANIALSQKGLPLPKSLSLEVPDSDGKWIVARDSLGCPAGKDKTILIDLNGVFRPGAPRRLRLRTSMEVYWNAIRWAAGLSHPQIKSVRLNPETADLSYRGFSATHIADKSVPEEIPEYDHIVNTGQQWRDIAGYYTRYGDVRDLLEKADDRYVIVNAGDEIRLRFAAPPPPPPGWVRDFVLIGNGWIKDGDPNSLFSQSLLPLPSRDRTEYNNTPARLEDDPVYRRHSTDWAKYHTRYVTPDRFKESLMVRKEQ